jgi:putative oxidoreductase
MHSLCSFSILIGRIGLSAIFILAGIGKFMDYSSTAAYMASKGMPVIPFFLYAAAIVEFLGGLGLLLGFKTRYCAAILALFLIPTTFIFHDFWNVEGVTRHLQMAMFMKNLAIFGGLFYVIGCGAGRFSVDACCCKKNLECQK